MNYLIVKEKNKKSAIYFEYNKINGFNMTPKNKNIKLKNAINVNKMIIVNPSFIEKIVDKKINKKLIQLINLIINISDNDEEDPASSLMYSLNEVEKFKREVLNKYLAFLNKKQLEKLDQKIKYLEQEVTMKAYYVNERFYQDVYKNKKSR